VNVRVNRELIPGLMTGPHEVDRCGRFVRLLLLRLLSCCLILWYFKNRTRLYRAPVAWYLWFHQPV